MSSGDVGHFDDGGRLFVDGRDDEMIVSGGENVFPREVEDLLAEHDARRRGRGHRRRGREVRPAPAAFVVARGRPASSSEDELKDHVKANLARYKVPREIVFLEELPRNATGKVLKRELAAARGLTRPGVILVRPASARDVPALHALGVRTWRATYEGVLPSAAVEQRRRPSSSTRTRSARPCESGRMLAAFRDGMLVGLLEFDRVDAARTMVWKLYVDPDAQGRGIGGLLLERLLQTAGTARGRGRARRPQRGRGGVLRGPSASPSTRSRTRAEGARTVRRVRRLSR